MTIRRVTIRNFKRFREQQFDLGEAVVLAGPNNSGKSTLLQAIATWRFALDRWSVRRSGGQAVTRSGVAIPRADITPVPLREMNLLWEDRRVTGVRGMSGPRRLIEIIVEGQTNGDAWTCGMELAYANPELIYAKPHGAKHAERDALRSFPPKPAQELDIVHVPPLSGIERDEPRRDRGMQDLLVGQGRPGEILRNLLLEIAERKDTADWDALTGHIRTLFRIDLQKPAYSSTQPYIVCEYREDGGSRPLDLSNAGSGTLQVLLLLAFLYARPAAVILLDEPDAHQHIILQRQVYDLLRKAARARGGQVIAATHSETILDATAPEQVISFLERSPRILANETERDRLREVVAGRQGAGGPEVTTWRPECVASGMQEREHGDTFLPHDEGRIRRHPAGRRDPRTGSEETTMTRETDLLARITVRPDVFRGKPIIRDMRMAVEHVLEMLAAGMSAETILHEFPFLEAEDIQACLVFAHRSIAGERVFDYIAVREVS